MILAEPKALIGFAGPRVIQQTINQELPPGFQRSEFVLDHGMVDMIVHRTELKKTVAWLLRFFAARSVLPQRPRRRAGESLERFRAASLPIGTALPPLPPPPAPETHAPGGSEPGANGDDPGQATLESPSHAPLPEPQRTRPAPVKEVPIQE